MAGTWMGWEPRAQCYGDTDQHRRCRDGAEHQKRAGRRAFWLEKTETCWWETVCKQGLISAWLSSSQDCSWPSVNPHPYRMSMQRLLRVFKVPRAIPWCLLSCQARHRQFPKKCNGLGKAHRVVSPRVTPRAGRAPSRPQSWGSAQLQSCSHLANSQDRTEPAGTPFRRDK